jgi:hypothetical protein
MSATIHNSTALAALVEQPGATFTQSRSGFDTGRRTFKCLSASVANLVPMRGDADSTFPNMKVDTVTTTFERAGLAMVDVSYLGEVVSTGEAEKPDEFTYTVNYEPNGANFSVTINGTTSTIDTSIFHPQVTHVYITSDLPTSKVGQYIDPERFADLVPEDVIDVPGISQTWTYNVLYKGWKLTGRTIRENGERYEISDTYSYDFVFSGVTVT